MHSDGLTGGESGAVVLISDNHQVMSSRRHRQFLIDGEGTRSSVVGAEEDSDVIEVDADRRDLLRGGRRTRRNLHRRSYGGPGGGRTDFDARTGGQTRTGRCAGHGEGFRTCFSGAGVIVSNHGKRVTSRRQRNVSGDGVARDRQLRHVVNVNAHGGDGPSGGRTGGSGDVHGGGNGGGGGRRTDGNPRGRGHRTLRLHEDAVRDLDDRTGCADTPQSGGVTAETYRQSDIDDVIEDLELLLAVDPQFGAVGGLGLGMKAADKMKGRAPNAVIDRHAEIQTGTRGSGTGRLGGPGIVQIWYEIAVFNQEDVFLPVLIDEAGGNAKWRRVDGVGAGKVDRVVES